METVSFTSILVLGFVLGVRHAFDADHLTAVMTMVTRGVPLRRSWLVGTIWGLGHTTALLIAAIIVLAIGAQIPDNVARLLEFAIAAMLVLLGARVLYLMLRGRTTHMHLHQHGRRLHLHPHQHPPIHDHAAPDSNHHGAGRQSYIIGLVHGLAGSAALLLVVVADGGDAGQSLLYVLAFGLGSAGGMLAMSTLLTVPFAWTVRRLPAVNELLRGVAGAGSIAVGLAFAYRLTII